MIKRLFIFAAYDKDNIIDDTLLYYLQELSKLGDIVFTMDNDTPKSEMDKLSHIPNILHATAIRHNEYDFGSYKRGYIWAKDNKILNKYDWIYFVNDSVYGPLWNIEHILQKLENQDAGMIGLYENVSENIPQHIQSWFVGFKNSVVKKDFFYKFINNIHHNDDKWNIILKYEVGFSRLIIQNGYKFFALYKDDYKNDCLLYEKPQKILEYGIPFIKKSALCNICDFKFLMPYCDDDFIQKIKNHASRYNLSINQNISTDKYKKCFRLTFLSIPILTVRCRKNTDYKVFVFDKIPILKIVTQKVKDNETV